MRPTELPKTLQEIFNVVWMRSKDKRQSRTILTGCRYRLDESDPSSLACFIGECIPDALYPQIAEFIEDKLVYVISTSIGGIWDGFIGSLYDLQLIHDIRHPDTWETELIEFANRNNLTIPQ